MQIPYRKGLLHSSIDYERLIKMQSESSEEKERIKDTKSKTMIKTKTYEKSRIHRGGNKWSM